MAVTSKWAKYSDDWYRERVGNETEWRGFCDSLGADESTLRRHFQKYRPELLKEVRGTLDRNRASLKGEIRKEQQELDATKRQLDTARADAEALSRDVTTEAGRIAEGLRNALQAERREHKRTKDHVLSQEETIDRIVNESRDPLPAPKLTFRRSKGKRQRDAILHISDLHYGQKVGVDDTPGGINILNREVFDIRLQRYTDAVCGISMDYSMGHTLDTLWLAFGGDILEGWGIFNGQEWHLFCDPMQQVVEGRSRIKRMIQTIVDVAVNEAGIKEVNAIWVNGNHGTPGGRKAGAVPSTLNWDWLLASLLRDDFAEWPLNLFAIEPGGACHFESKGNIGLMQHGDTVKGSLGIPWYGFTRADARNIRSSNIIHDFGLVGHFHQAAVTPIGHGRIYHNGNAVGTNNLGRFVGSGPASQNMFFVSEDHGVAAQIEIQLQTREERLVMPVIHGQGE